MSTYMARPKTSEDLKPIASALTEMVNYAHLAVSDDIVVYFFDSSVDDWMSLPAAWYNPATREIAVNYSKMIAGSAAIQKELSDIYNYRRRTILTGLETVEDYPEDKRLQIKLGSEFSKQFTGDIAKLISNTTHLYKRAPLSGSADIRNQLFKVLGKKYASIAFKMYSPMSYESAHESLVAETIRTIFGVIIHETGHALTAEYLIDPWWRKLDPVSREIITMFEELRCEAMQVQRTQWNTEIKAPYDTYNNSLASFLVRSAADLVVDPAKIAEDIKNVSDEDGAIYAGNIALSSTLILGRQTYGVFSVDEVKELHDLVETVVGKDRIREMYSIWIDYIQVDELTEEIALGYVNRWLDIFPKTSMKSSVAPVFDSMKDFGVSESSGMTIETEDEMVSSEDGSSTAKNAESDLLDRDEGDDGQHGEEDDKGEEDRLDDEDEDEDMVKLPGIVEVIEKESSSTTGEIARNADESASASAIKPTLSTESYRLSEKQTKRWSANIKSAPVEPEDRAMANRLYHTLQRIYLSGRGKRTYSTKIPPGKIRARAAVQNAAYRKVNSPAVHEVEQWSRTKLTISDNPELAVGIMTDCSGSQNWAEMFSARTSWILSSAFRRVHARTASVAFGEMCYITTKPDSVNTELKIVPAVEMTERFDQGAGTLDQMLKLTSNVGVRVLFVITDGHFVTDPEPEVSQMWIDQLISAGCHVVWITPDYYHSDTPENVYNITVEKSTVASDPQKVIEKIMQYVERQLSNEKVQQKSR